MEQDFEKLKILKISDFTYYSERVGVDFELTDLSLDSAFYSVSFNRMVGNILKTNCEIIEDQKSFRPEELAGDVIYGANPLEIPDNSKTILQEAQGIVYGERQDAYGSVTENFGNIAKLWSATLKFDVTPEQVGLCLIQLKIARQMNKSKRDNLVDIAGYAATLEKLQKGE